MSIVNYLGCNFTLPFSDDDSDDKILIGDFFSDEQMRKDVKKNFSTKYVYEVTSNEFGSIWFNEYYKSDYPKGHLEGHKSFKALCEFLDGHLKIGDYCELYTCWFGDELEDKEFEQTLNINNFDINHINIFEKTLLVIKK
ncbi:hypothetical protein ACFFHM_03750 [Halalkalibacter kiskunsagensis]|uniref:Uncharacterized protein n=1 Tax=Halalkalibacter kiskunsagensis TaxID=1548599 RepID=A0ABV6KCT8_9BACI